MQETKKPVGRPPSKNKKTKWLKIRVTPEMDTMLKDAPKSDLINKGLHILMPTLGKKWDGEKWQQWEHEGTAANLVAYRAICYAIELQMDIWQRDRDGFSAENSVLLSHLRTIKTELEAHSTFSNPNKETT